MKKFLKFVLIGFGILFALGVIGAMLSDDTAVEDTPAPETAVTEPVEAVEEESAEEETTEETEETEESEPAEESSDVAGIGDELKVGEVVYKVNGRTEATNVGGEYGQNSKGKYLLVNVTVRNEGTEALTVDTSLFKLVSGEITYDADGVASMYANDDNNFFLENLNAGLELTGEVVFDISEGAHADELHLNVQTGFFGTEQGQIALQ